MGDEYEVEGMAPVPTAPLEPQTEKQRAGVAAEMLYLERQEELIKEHKDKWIVISDTDVKRFYDSYSDAVNARSTGKISVYPSNH